MNVFCDDGFDIRKGIRIFVQKRIYNLKQMTNLIQTVFLFILFIIADSLAVYGQSKYNIVQKMEGEVRAGLTTPVGGYHTGKSQIGASLGLEGRYNFKGTPWDCGLMLDLSTARRGYEHLYNDGYDRWQSNRTLALALTGDYNFRQGNKFNPFAGTAIGVAYNDVVGDKYFPFTGMSMLFAPRVGVELLYHFRITAQFNISRKGFHNLSLAIGLTIGGRRQKESRE